MGENEIMTTDNLFKYYSNLYQFEEGDPEYLVDKEDFKEALIKFTKHHVKLALENCWEKALIEKIEYLQDGSEVQLDIFKEEYCNGSWIKINKDSILNTYTEDLIV